MGDEHGGPIRLAVVDDYDVVVHGVARMFAHYRDQVVVVDLAANEPVEVDVDIALIDTFAQDPAGDALDVLLANPRARRVVLYTWVFDEEMIRRALDKGAAGYLSKTARAADLVESLRRVHAGEIVIDAPPRRESTVGQEWPGREEGLTARESEVLAFIAQGYRNADIARLTAMSINSVKAHIRRCYARIGVSSRTQAVLWALTHGFEPDDTAVKRWR
jgi:DNA-binding NarL/FixJ family response regulator